MPVSPSSAASARPTWWRGPLVVLVVCAALAAALAGWHYATAEEVVLPVRPVAQLTPVPTTVARVPFGVSSLPLQANGYLITQTWDVAGPFLRPGAALALMAFLGVALAYFLAAVSQAVRPVFVAGMALVIFLLMSLNADLLGIFDVQHRYVLLLLLAALGGPAYYFHAFRPDVAFGPRLALFAGLVAGLGAGLFLLAPGAADETALQLSAFFTTSGAVAFGLLVLWVAFENVHGLLWLNTQAETPAGRFGRWPFVLTSGLYLGMLLLYYLNQSETVLLPGLRLDPYVLLIPAVVMAALSMQRRASTFQEWLPYPEARVVFGVLVLLAAAVLGYALATANDPLVQAGRDFTVLAFLCVGGAFLLYVLLNYAPLLRQKLPVYRVVFEPRRLPFYAMYAVGLAALVAVELRNNLFVLDQVQAASFNNLGDLARLESEATPDDMSQALLAERYYAESDALDQHNHKASLGRAALYRFRLQRQNEINILRRALSRRPSERISLRLAALFNEPTDFFDRLAVLREGLKATPGSAALNGDLAQLYSRSTLTDSTEFYQARATAAAPHDAVLQANQLAYLIKQQQWKQARQLAQDTQSSDDAALHSNALLLAQLSGQPAQRAVALPDTAAALTPARFARFYHAALARAHYHDTTLLATLPRLLNHPANDAYHDQLVFVRALTQHYGGQPVAAQTTLAPLATGSEASAAYYQQVQGLWLLDQGLPAPAALRLHEARQNGSATAALPEAAALALSGQPDSARNLLQRTMATTEAATRPVARQLLTVLEPDFRAQLPQSSDSLRAQFLVVRGDELSAAELLPSATGITTPALRAVALRAQLTRGLQLGQLAPVQQALQQQAPAVQAAGASPWNVLRGEVYVQTRQWPALRQLLRQGRFEGFDQLTTLYFRAALADADKQPKQAAALYAEVVQRAPFVENGLVAAAAFYARQHDDNLAYNTLLRGVEYNPTSVPLLKAYVLASIPVGLTEYAQSPLYRLGTLLSPADYATFRTEYETRRAARAAAAAPWN